MRACVCMCACVYVCVSLTLVLHEELPEVPERRAVHELNLDLVRLRHVDVLLTSVRAARQHRLLRLAPSLVDGRQLVADGGVGAQQLGPAGAAGEVEEGDVDALPRGDLDDPGASGASPAVLLGHVRGEEAEAVRAPQGAPGATRVRLVRRNCGQNKMGVSLKLRNFAFCKMWYQVVDR